MVNILIGCTGSVASIKLPLLIQKLIEKIPGADIKVILTSTAAKFINLQQIEVPVYMDENEWMNWKKIGDDIIHISLRNWANLLLIAPLDANTLGKIASGICDNLLTCVLRAWMLNERPVLVCPAMNTYMWRHPVTKENMDKLKSWGYTEIAPISKKLACGDDGFGAMEEIEQIVEQVICSL